MQVNLPRLTSSLDIGAGDTGSICEGIDRRGRPLISHTEFPERLDAGQSGRLRFPGYRLQRVQRRLLRGNQGFTVLRSRR